MKLHNLDNLPRLEEEVKDLDFWDIFGIPDDIDDSDSKEETIDSCISMVSEFDAQEDSKGRAKVFKKMTGQTPAQYWNNKDDMDICRYEDDKEKGQLMGDDTFYAGISANHNRLY